jgi:tetratricopeptide (TPR) repeat protein
MTKGTPNTLLREARIKCELKQRFVAKNLGVDVGTLSRWERGVIPKRLSQHKLAAFYQTTLTALGFPEEPARVSPVWLVPHRRNRYYTGYEQTLQALYKALHTKKAAVLTQALSGLGGIGKTQLALEYAYRYRDGYTDVLWIGADSPTVLLSSLVEVVKKLGLPMMEPLDQQQVLSAFQSWLSTRRNWLLILDNVEDLAILDQIIPLEETRQQGHIVLTTRAQAVGTWANKITVDTMPETEGATFLLRRAKVIPRNAPLHTAAETDQEKALEITGELDGLPLALDQAGAYIEEAPSSLAEYLDLYREQRAALLDRRGIAASGHPESVTTTFTLSFTKVQKDQPAAAELLQLCAFFHPDAIPEALLVQGTSHLSPLLQSTVSNPIQFREALTTLSKYSLLNRNVSAKTLSTHRLVQAILRDMMDEAMQRQWAEQVVRVMVRAFALEGSDTWQNMERYAPHTLVCAEMIERLGLKDEMAATLLSRAGLYLRQRAGYTQAERFYEQALVFFEQLFGPEHPEVATVLNNRALVYQEQRRHAEAQHSFERALEILEKTYPPAHPDRARTMGNLAHCHWSQGHMRDALRIGQQAKILLERALGPQTLELASLLITLAAVYRDLGELQEAETLYQRGLAIQKQLLPPGHPSIALTFTGIATNQFLLHRYKSALDYNERALTMLKQTLGPQHPEVALCLFCLADTYMMLGDWKQAEEYNLRSLAIYEKIEGPILSDIAQPLHGLAMLAQLRGRFDQAESHYQRALSILEQTQGPDYPDLIALLRAYATLLYLKGQRQKARTLEARADAIERKIEGEDSA